MSAQRQPLFDSSLAALVLVNGYQAPRQPSVPRLRAVPARVNAGNTIASPIQFSPEADPTTTGLELGEGQTTGPVSLGFEFEFFGDRYTWFDLSSDGFMTFIAYMIPGQYPAGRMLPASRVSQNFIALGCTDVGPLGHRRVVYEVRGEPGRRRLVLSFSRAPASRDRGLGIMTVQLVLHERTGMIDIHTSRQEPTANRVKQEAVRFTTAP